VSSRPTGQLLRETGHAEDRGDPLRCHVPPEDATTRGARASNLAPPERLPPPQRNLHLPGVFLHTVEQVPAQESPGRTFSTVHRMAWKDQQSVKKSRRRTSRPRTNAGDRRPARGMHPRAGRERRRAFRSRRASRTHATSGIGTARNADAHERRGKPSRRAGEASAPSPISSTKSSRFRGILAAGGTGAGAGIPWPRLLHHPQHSGERSRKG